MLTVSTSEDFAQWWEALADADAEDVATGVALIESLGPDRSPPDSSELLLWYQAQPGYAPYRFDREAIAFAQIARALVNQLSSVGTLSRLAQVSPERAQRFQQSVSAIAARARRWRHTPDDHDGLALQAEYRAAIEALGLQVAPIEPPQTMLRELSFRARNPGLRVLYGVDRPRRRALLISGEPLDRRAYGPSVRRALAIWQSYLASADDAPELAAGSSK